MSEMEKNERKPVDFEEQDRRRLERNLRLVEEPDAVVIIPFAKPGRFALTYMAMHVDRVVANIKRQIGFRMDFDRAQALLKSLGEFIDRLWERMIKVAPNLHYVKKEEWRRLNDPVDLRRKLAYRKLAFALVPRSEEAGQAAVAIKVLENQNFLLRQTTGSFDALKEMTEDYCNLVREFDEFLAKLSAEAELEYRSPLRSKKDSPQEEPAAPKETEAKKSKART